MNPAGLIESIFDRVLADKEETILKIKVEDIINDNEPENEPEPEDEHEHEIELEKIEIESNLSLKSKTIDEEDDVNVIPSPNNNEPVGKDEEFIEETEEMLTPEPISKSDNVSFIRRLCSCLYK